MKTIDLTLTLRDGLLSFASHPPIEIKEQSTFENSKHRYQAPSEGFESRMLKFSDHSGTHIDAPLHFIRGGQSTAEMELEKTMGPALVLDISDFKGPQEAVTAAMLEKAEAEQGLQVTTGDIVLVRTRKGQWGDDGFFEEYAFEKSAGEWLVSRGIKLIGLDLPNIDINHNMTREVHMDVLGANIYIVENLVNLEQLPRNKRFQFLALPLKLSNSTASPVRAIALVDEEPAGDQNG
ncbi:cyclase family protein [Planococcus salinus]|uniref:Cyclase family protein n=1 Tax=Planococcus salinus TaxID=1848460 RepID=A0A3M8P840_9BACL|nr:cyclase family protein [Planococcus salinus]RNF39808.1 cyclase family protein [Planococcus salinus]